MKYFRGYKKKKNYFEGWYFKQNTNDFAIAFIPSIIMDKKGQKKALIQVITNSFSECFYFEFSDFFALRNKLFIKIKNNIFSEQGIMLNLENENYSIQAEILFDKFTTIKPIMGFFSYLPFLQCYHDIISMKHLTNGFVNINEKTYELKNAHGYIEKDAGRDFPSKYIWMQSNSFDKDLSFSMSIASIPFYGFNFLGVITSIIYQNQEYRLATYNNSKITSLKKNHLILKNKYYTLEVKYQPGASYSLYAPLNGKMNRIIDESLSSKLSLKFYFKNILILESVSEMAGVEDLFFE